MPPNVDSHLASLLIPLANKLGFILNDTSHVKCLPGLVCLTCRNCVAVYQPENKNVCQSLNEDNHYRSIENILRSGDENKVVRNTNVFFIFHIHYKHYKLTN